MRLVTATYFETVEHTCVDPRGKHCFGYAPGDVHTDGPSRALRVCMDEYEAPNRRGARPIVMKDAREAGAFCAAHGKRLCTEAEWESACEGAERRPYLYGWRTDEAICNSGKPWRPFDQAALAAGGARADAEVARLWQGEPSGARAHCVTPEGISDLLGNVEEWVTARPGRPYPVALKGGFWAKPWTTCRGTNDAHEGSFRFYEIGFRCCRDPDAP
jgi:formylglycine-generating enzyme required for sulfatase activity